MAAKKRRAVCRICQNSGIRFINLVEHSNLCTRISDQKVRLYKVNQWLIEECSIASNLKNKIGFDLLISKKLSEPQLVLLGIPKDVQVNRGSPMKKPEGMMDLTLDHCKSMEISPEASTDYAVFKGNSGGQEAKSNRNVSPKQNGLSNEAEGGSPESSKSPNKNRYSPGSKRSATIDLLASKLQEPTISSSSNNFLPGTGPSSNFGTAKIIRTKPQRTDTKNTGHQPSRFKLIHEQTQRKGTLHDPSFKSKFGLRTSRWHGRWKISFSD